MRTRKIISKGIRKKCSVVFVELTNFYTQFSSVSLSDQGELIWGYLFEIEELANKYEGQAPPCIIAAQFLIRAGKLVCIIFLRSFDVYKYLLADLGFFYRLSRRIAKKLDLEDVKIYLCVGSAHYYTG